MRFYVGHRLPGGFWAGMSTYARRPHRAARDAARTTGGIGCIGWIVLIVVFALSIRYWFVSVPVLVLTAVAVGVTVHRRHDQLRRAAATAATPPPPAPPRPSPSAALPSAPPQRHVSPDAPAVGDLVHLVHDGAGVHMVPVTAADLDSAAQPVYRIERRPGSDAITLTPVSGA